METVQVFIKTEEEDDQKDVLMHHTQSHPEETSCTEPGEPAGYIWFIVYLTGAWSVIIFQGKTP